MISVSHAVITLFPVIRPSENGKPVAGEIYTVDDEVLERLDRLEGVHKGMYSRELIDVTLPLANGERLPSKAFIYVAGPDGWQEHFDRCRRTASSMSAANWIGDRSHGTDLSFDDDNDGYTNPEGQRTSDTRPQPRLASRSSANAISATTIAIRGTIGSPCRRRATVTASSSSPPTTRADDRHASVECSTVTTTGTGVRGEAASGGRAAPTHRRATRRDLSGQRAEPDQIEPCQP